MALTTPRPTTSLQALARRLRRDERGNVALTFALVAAPVFGIMGLSVDFGRAVQAKQQLQSSLDAAVLASRNLTGAEQTERAMSFFHENFRPDWAETQVSFQTEADLSLRGSATAAIQTPFASFLGIPSIEVMASSVASPDQTVSVPGPGGIPCLHIMDQSGSGSFTLTSNSQLDASSCEVRVRSNHASAMVATSNSNVKFKKIEVKGGASVTSGPITIIDAPNTITTNAQVVGNPYEDAIRSVADLVTVGACSTSNTGKTYTGTVSPGTYCGTTTFNGVTFSPGVYVISSAPGKDGNLKIMGRVTGNGVTFYFADNKAQLLSYTASENSTLSAPADGPTRGLLFFEKSNRGSKWSVTIASVNKQSWTGMIYLPGADITLNSLSEWPKMWVSMAVNRLTAISLSSVMTPYQWTPWTQGTPISIGGSEVSTVVSGRIKQ